MIDDLVNLGFDAGAAFCEMFILYSVLEHLSEKRFYGIKQFAVKLGCTVVMALAVVFLDTALSFFSITTLIISSVLPPITAKLFCKGKITDFVAVSMIYYLIVTVGGMLVSYIIDMLFIPNFTIHIMNFSGWERNLYFAVSKLLLILYYIAFVRLFHRKLHGFFGKIFGVVILFCLWYHFMIAVLLDSVQKHNIIAFDHTVLMILLFMAIALITALVFTGWYCIAREKKIQEKMSEYQKSILESNYLRLNRMYKGAARGMHDYKNHILVIRELLANKSYDEAEVYVNTLCENLKKENFAQTYTGVEIVDAVLNVKQNEGLNCGIKVDIRASYPHNCGIDSVDICTILGNLLDNAIEACAKIEPREKRHIGVRISYTENIVMIKIENTVGENPFMNGTPLETTKKDRRSHGLGISIVRKAAEKYNGDLKQICENGVFVSKVILYSNSGKKIGGQKSQI